MKALELEDGVGWKSPTSLSFSKTSNPLGLVPVFWKVT